ncbi:hypothetical protein ACFWOD_21485, partial [Streptomyces sp. NPDC058434]
MGKLTVGALRAVLVVVFAGTVFVQAGMVWALVSGSVPASPSKTPETPRPYRVKRKSWYHGEKQLRMPKEA